MSPSKPAQHSESNADNDPTWDTSSLVLPKYHVDMCEAIDDDPEYTSLIQYGYVTIKGIHYFVSINHIDRYVRDLIPAGSASSPTIIMDTDFTTIPVSAPVNIARAVKKAVAVSAVAGDHYPWRIQTESGNGVSRVTVDVDWFVA